MKRLIEPVVDGCYRIPLGFVNAFVVAKADELTLVDCGMPGSTDRIEAALQSIGFSLAQLSNILVTHCHPDHAGSLAELQRRSPRAKTFMHVDDAKCVRSGIAVPRERPLVPSPGLHNYLLFHCFLARVATDIEPARVDRLVHGGQRLPIAGGVSVVHSPGHSAGHVCYLWHGDGGVLFAGDVAQCVWGPSYSIAYEDFELGKQTLCDLTSYPFEYACFGHGRTLIRSASRKLAKAFDPHYSTRLVPAAEGVMRDAMHVARQCGVQCGVQSQVDAEKVAEQSTELLTASGQHS